MRTYKAVQVTEPGKLQLVELPIRERGRGQVRLRVEAWGVCHSDMATVEAQFPGLTLPRVPGHEVVGHIEEVGPDVSNWKLDNASELDSSAARTENAKLVSAVTL
jgi:alcohol dehydrogenase, propanol-preferring